ncbi:MULTISPECIES: LacI family DNA-binding transcriptional regulator [unclassified Streptomyces]|uniref:LacI family DNA-binding transcriptional regulator n=1 Tax=Streptomyces TaxID=1883 RepID=UPI0001C18BCF|nr:MULTISPECIES: LacI family DNA-binding transcriptional regulator [unclassified Streptomyces]AEN13685.1 transcriptional regulator, LacI family [Streptomyces sp. SirexAA-E]MYR65679.1 substrate-binding domain-containing protein [Streptomyces sp. SID4939]MYS04518.1 substrate-binding domain-containing protein [Streptomyces sp. SID4940]MYT67576.1 substrate-binding domain-containing protein [Streptomyces sp. SID8357]MYT86420.1 substrate-binding domain-containing protein [Streptomyces sp. SID8360]
MPDPIPDPQRDVRPTLEAVASRAGVSRATVSRVVNGGAGVRQPLVDQVRKAVDELGYIPNHAARTLVTRRNGAVAVIIDEPEFRIFSDPFFSRQIRGISRELNAHDAQLVLLLVEGRGDFDRVTRYLAGGHVDGVLAFSLHTDDELPAIIRRFRVPTVYGGRPERPVRGDSAGAPVPYVDCDNRGGAREAVRHLVSLGRRHIAHIAGPRDQTSALDRIEGYHDVLPDADPALTVVGDFTADGGARAMTRLLEVRPDLDAVFVANDLMASGALRVLRGRGLRVPEEVALVGFDDMTSVAEATDPPLTTVRQDVEGMGRLMVRLLMERLDSDTGEWPDSVVTPTELIRRASA